MFSASKDAEIDLTVMRVENEVAQEDFDKKQKERQQQNPQHTLQYQSPLVRRPELMRMRGRTELVFIANLYPQRESKILDPPRKISFPL